ncbi:MAG: hypothetical protein D6712_21325 [Chloroflexi bacterium]|nr:MAG: hypothetical protein D6712_21325 [Chloroflexota bacterium]
MNTETLIITLALSSAVLVWTLWPLLRRRQENSHLAEYLKQEEQLRVLYDRVLTNVRDLDEDYDTGKITEDDYRQERDLWVQRGVQVLKAMDVLQAQMQAAAPQINDDDDEVEAAIARYKQGLRA